MKLLAFSVYDSAVGAYLQPFFVRSTGEAIRSFQDAVNDQKHQFATHMMDYTLFQVGIWSDEGGLLEGMAPQRIATAMELTIKDVTPIAKV